MTLSGKHKFFRSKFETYYKIMNGQQCIACGVVDDETLEDGGK